jgi:RNA polymerase sigma-70 factor (ECF subfamily)
MVMVVPAGRQTERDLTQALAGDPTAQGRLLERYRAYLELLARFQIGRRLAQKVDASDVVQEALLKASRGFADFRGKTETEMAAWLRHVLASALVDQVRRFYGSQRRNIRLERRLLGALDRSSQALDGGLISPHSSPSQRASRQERAVLVANALTRLPEHYREVLVLRHLEELSFPEIARRSGQTVDAVKSLWTRALARLRESFKEWP